VRHARGLAALHLVMRSDGRRIARMRVPALLVISVAVLWPASIGTAAMSTAARTSARAHACRVPRLTGATFEIARLRAARDRCALHVKGAALQEASVQTVARQLPTSGGRSSSVTVWLNPLCNGEAAYGPDIKEPVVTKGPTELVSGFYLVGGPLLPFSAPRCKRPAPPPGAGKMEVIDASGALVATRTASPGHFVRIRLPAGSYTIRGTFLNATENGVHPQATESLVIPPARTVRQDFFLGIK
jgi:hypothetical protein